MSDQELFGGFRPEVQAGYERQLVARFGKGMKKHLAQSHARVKDWTKGDWEKSKSAFAGICQDLVKAMGQGLDAESAAVQGIIRRHYLWLRQFWTPTRESYAGHGQFIVDSELRQAYEAHHPDLPEFAAAAMRAFAKREL